MYGNGVSKMSGKLAGNVYARNKSGDYARNWAKPTNQPTPLQSAVRAAFAAVAVGWGALTQVQRDDWDTLAFTKNFLNRLGQAIQFSGQQVYNKVNISLSSVLQATINTAPADLADPPPPDLFTVVADDSANTITITGGNANVPAGTTFKVEIAVNGTGKKNLKNVYRFLGVVNAAVAWDTLDLNSIVPAPVAFVAGDLVSVRVTAVYTYNGMSSPPLIVDTTAVA